MVRRRTPAPERPRPNRSETRVLARQVVEDWRRTGECPTRGHPALDRLDEAFGPVAFYLTAAFSRPPDELDVERYVRVLVEGPPEDEDPA